VKLCIYAGYKETYTFCTHTHTYILLSCRSLGYWELGIKTAGVSFGHKNWNMSSINQEHTHYIHL